jgi:DNA-binding transcriptional ArsR family regulator
MATRQRFHAGAAPAALYVAGVYGGGRKMDARIYRLEKPKSDYRALLDNTGNAKEIFRLLANENRLKILCYVAPEEKSVSQILAFTGLPQATVSQHLALLRGKGLVEPRRDGKTKYYKLKHAETRAILEFLDDVFELGFPA